ncbi:MAG TPA: serine protease [Kofleriaceae bacterium]|nr:serine protease [Kofleriaceae bacterium]
MPHPHRLPTRALLATLTGAAPARADRLTSLRTEFERYSGAALVFRRAELPRADYYEIMPELEGSRAEAAAAIAVREVKKYPPGYLGDIGLRAVGIFAGLASKKGDGFRPWSQQLGGYRYFGMWNGNDALIGAYYTDEQLPLTLHHELFHHVDGTAAGRTDYDEDFTDDDAAFRAAVDGRHRYPALAVDATDLAALAKLGDGYVLRDAVSDYAAKNPGEDQAETARYLMSALPDALVQMARRPELAGSQRMLHVLAQYGRALDGQPDTGWFVDVALGRDPVRGRFAARADRAVRSMQQRIVSDGRFVIWGREDASGVNWTLRGDLARFGSEAAALRAAAPSGAEDLLARAAGRMIDLLDRYQRFVTGGWTLSAGTRDAFAQARAQMTAAAEAARPRDKGTLPYRRPRFGAEGGNPYLAKVDAAIADARVRAAIRRVQPAAVRLDNGSGWLITADGVIITAAHVVDKIGRRSGALLPDGRKFTATTFAIDGVLDIAALRIDTPVAGLPFVTMAPAAPEVGDLAVCIGQPGRYTPDGEPTGYQPFHVSVGHIRGFLPDRLGAQQLGRTKHDAWTYWGHSGSPIFDGRGRIIAMHNSWDSTTAMRHAVTWEALVDFLGRYRIPYTTAR